MFATQDEDSVLKMIDFGQSQRIHSRELLHKIAGTVFYESPQQVDLQYNKACDVWSVGVVMFVLLYGFAPFFHRDDAQIYRQIRHGFTPVVRPGKGAYFSSDINVSASARDLIAKMLVTDVAERLTPEEVLEHPWLCGGVVTPVGMIDDVVVANLRRFNMECKFKQAVCKIMMVDLPPATLKAYHDSFAQMDTLHHGFITIDELRAAVTAVPHFLPPHDPQYWDAHIDGLMHTLDLDGDGKVQLSEWVSFLVNRRLSAREERLQQAFRRLDVNGDGKVTLGELKTVMSDVSEEHLQAYVEGCDANHDGSIDFSEFLAAWNADPSMLQPHVSPKQAAARPREPLSNLHVKPETLRRVEAIQSLTVNVQPVSDPPIDEDAVLRKITWRLLPYIGWLYMLCFLDRINLSNVHGTILADLAMSETDYSTAVGVFFIGYITCELPSNLVLTQVQPRIWIARILITWGGITCCFAACNSKAGLIVCRLFLGMAEAGFFPGMVRARPEIKSVWSCISVTSCDAVVSIIALCLSGCVLAWLTLTVPGDFCFCTHIGIHVQVYYLSLWYKTDEIAARIAMFYSTSAIAGFLGGLLAYGVLQLDGVGGLRGWQWLFLSEGIPTVLSGISVYWLLPNEPRGSDFLTKDEQEWVHQRRKPVTSSIAITLPPTTDAAAAAGICSDAVVAMSPAPTMIASEADPAAQQGHGFALESASPAARSPKKISWDDLRATLMDWRV